MLEVKLRFVVSQVQRAAAGHITLTLAKVMSVTGSSAVPKIPIAKTEEEKAMDRIMKQAQETLGMDLYMQAMMMQKLASTITLPMEEYEKLGRPSVEDMVTVTLIKDEVTR